MRQFLANAGQLTASMLLIVVVIAGVLAAIAVNDRQYERTCRGVLSLARTNADSVHMLVNRSDCYKYIVSSR